MFRARVPTCSAPTSRRSIKSDKSSSTAYSAFSRFSLHQRRAVSISVAARGLISTTRRSFIALTQPLQEGARIDAFAAIAGGKPLFELAPLVLRHDEAASDHLQRLLGEGEVVLFDLVDQGMDCVALSHRLRAQDSTRRPRWRGAAPDRRADGVIPSIRRKVRLMWPASEKPAATAASATNRSRRRAPSAPQPSSIRAQRSVILRAGPVHRHVLHGQALGVARSARPVAVSRADRPLREAGRPPGWATPRPTRRSLPDGTPGPEHHDSIAFAQAHPEDLPFLGWSVGRQDGFATWQEHVEMVATMTATRHDFAFSCNDGDHSSGVAAGDAIAMWYPQERFAQTPTRRRGDRPVRDHAPPPGDPGRAR